MIRNYQSCVIRPSWIHYNITLIKTFGDITVIKAIVEIRFTTATTYLGPRTSNTDNTVKKAIKDIAEITITKVILEITDIYRKKYGHLGYHRPHCQNEYQ
jgi:hypothetical protein